MIDAHQHFWRSIDIPGLERSFLPDDLRPLLAAAGVERTLLVQTRSSLEETRWFLELAAESGFVAGVIGWADLTSPDLGEQLDGLVGVRHQVHDEPDPNWLLRPDVIRGLGAVAAAGLPYDLLVRAPQLPAALKVASLRPELTFVVDHLAKPRIADGPRDLEWERGLAALADLPNVFCKLSGLVTEARWSDWTLEDLGPYVERALGWFGPERLIFGSDWPVCTLAGSYQQVLEAARSLVADERVFAANARRVYGLD
ncbi:MAG TPA: amidohydrolase family protein [Candidatus Dormibacteraeota bacterium]